MRKNRFDMEPKLSICLPVYNQKALVEWNLKNLIQCPINEIEIVVQDNGSTDDIQGLVQSIGDPRIRFFNNDENVGHDRSILRAFQNCRSKYAFLLRTSDTVYPDRIGEIIRFTEEHPRVGYCRFSCRDENGRVRIRYPDRIYPAGKAAAYAAEKIFMHPSGELYNLFYFNAQDWECLERYMTEEFSHNFRFIVHTMMREQLCTKAELATGSAIVWQYTYTVHRKDQAENSTKDRICVYAPAYLYERYRCEMHYILREIDSEDKKVLIDNIVDRYAKAAIFTFKYINRNKAMQQHYRYEEVPFSSREEMKKFREVTSALAEKAEEPYRTQIYQRLAGINEASFVKWHLERTGQIIGSRTDRAIHRLYRKK